MKKLLISALFVTACGTETITTESQSAGALVYKAVSHLVLDREPPGKVCPAGGTRFSSTNKAQSQLGLVSCIAASPRVEQPPNETSSPPARASFLDWCSASDVDSASQATVQAIMGKEKLSDCKEAAKKLASLDSLNLSGLALVSLAPLATLPNLQNLYLSKNKISDLSPLRALRELRNLQLDENQIRNVSPLADLSKLMSLNLSKNAIVDVKPLIQLKNLTRLQLDSNKIISAWPLQTLPKSTYIYLTDNPLSSQVFAVK